MSAKKIYVYAGWEADKLVGTIYSDIIKGKEVCSFEYDENWIKAHMGLNLDPNLPTVRYRIQSNDGMLFQAFEDSCPDRWGRTLIDRRESVYAAENGIRPKKFFETDYLLAVQDECRSGGFRFALKKDQFLTQNDEMPTPPITAIRELEQISLEYERGKNNRWITQLVAPGSSLGGARPKATVRDENNQLWLAKFPSSHDSYDIGAWEKTVHDLAKMCGIKVPESRLCKYSDLGSTFLVKRYDREYTSGQEERIHYASAMTMLGLRDGKTEGYGFLDLAELIVQNTKGADANLKELFRRMAFDISICNHDDHFRNHGFILKENRWELSPAFDMNPVPNEDFLSINIDMDDGYRSFEKALDTCDFYHLSLSEAKEIIRFTAGTVAENWRKISGKYKIKEYEQKMMSSAFYLAEEYCRDFNL